ncbi:raffinose/stachyose/melibiose transport system permease protein [Murinocardiopsis flavida]|uniref:Raffinose/stachyose/melibiose transport system permease protein n=1 Tax=Murinocardiopsis flavida TaxID=645275 RepID=A0A2P8DNW7_9ACTN|nr:sugar ABC transporter permease [Murinocardiopsis flavida]PSK98912.1 raffinose/stachyose/melibiose transport system permease protein [Murinocardiopsis flavida]
MTALSTSPGTRRTPRGPRRTAPRLHRRWDWVGLLYILPALVFFSVFVLYPLCQSVWLSLWEWDGVTAATWVGPQNYIDVLTEPDSRKALINSFVFIVFYAVLPAAIGLMFTGIMARIRIHGLTFFRTALFVPQILSGVVVAVAWRYMYAIDGPLNALLGQVGLGWLATAWLGEFGTALPAVGSIGTWVMFGLCMVLFLAGAQRIPAELYEAARIDGAGPIREFFTVTLPGLRREISFALVLTTTYALRNFDVVWNTTQGGPGDTTIMPSVIIYKAAFNTRDYGTAATLSVLLAALVLVVTGLVLFLFRDKEPRR